VHFFRPQAISQYFYANFYPKSIVHGHFNAAIGMFLAMSPLGIALFRALIGEDKIDLLACPFDILSHFVNLGFVLLCATSDDDLIN
jgi:hypothetical protein